MNLKFSYRPYIFLIAAFLIAGSLSDSTSSHVRSAMIIAISPTWSWLHSLKTQLAVKEASLTTPQSCATNEELIRLQLENHQLCEAVKYLQTILLQQRQAETLAARWNSLSKEENASSFFQRRTDEINALLQMHLMSVPATVIYRSTAAWESSFWINVGQLQNESLGFEIIAHNSPVVVGSALIGIVDYVGAKQSRVRLITDSGLTPSVRCARGASSNLWLLEQLDAVTDALFSRNDLSNDLDNKSLHIQLSLIRNKLIANKDSAYLAKGELAGHSNALWKSLGANLQGTGFNYDFADLEGPARDLRTGSCDTEKLPNSKEHTIPAIPILQIGDLLVTTGMDGVFPPGLRIATVSKVNMLEEGSCTYTLEAIPVAPSLNTLSTVFVLPPIGLASSVDQITKD